MRLIDRLTASRAIQATPWGRWPGEGSTGTWTGTRVDNQSALQLLTVYGCVRLIADSIATLPVDVFRKDGDGTRVEVTKPAWLMQPAPDLDWVAWCSQVLTSCLLDGNGWVWVDRTPSRGVVQLVPLDPAKVSVRREGGRKEVSIDGMPVDPFNIIHIPGVMFPGADVGLSPVEAARQSIGVGMSAQEYGARFFAQGASMSGVIETDEELTPDQLKMMANDFARRHSGKNKSGLPAVLTKATWKSTGVTNEQAQFLETRRFTAAEIAGQMFLVDPSDLGIGVEGSSLTYANLEQRNIRRVQVTLLPWIVRLETALSALLARPRYVKLNVKGLLRADTLTRYQSYAVGITNKFLLPNEAREHEELEPLDGGDEFAEPAVPAAAAEVPQRTVRVRDIVRDQFGVPQRIIEEDVVAT